MSIVLFFSIVLVFLSFTVHRSARRRASKKQVTWIIEQLKSKEGHPDPEWLLDKCYEHVTKAGLEFGAGSIPSWSECARLAELALFRHASRMRRSLMRNKRSIVLELSDELTLLREQKLVTDKCTKRIVDLAESLDFSVKERDRSRLRWRTVKAINAEKWSSAGTHLKALLTVRNKLKYGT